MTIAYKEVRLSKVPPGILFSELATLQEKNSQSGSNTENYSDKITRILHCYVDE